MNPKRQDFNEFATEYAEYRQIDPPVLKALIDAGKLDNNTVLLEVGCGTGNYISEIARRTQAACHGLDPAPKMLTKAQAKPNAHQIQWNIGYARQLNFTNEQFDLIYTVDVSHHILHLQTYFNETFRTLKPGGKVCTVTDSEWIISHREPLATYFPATIEVNLERYHPVAEILDCMVQAGFINILEKMVEYPYMLYDAAGYSHRAYSSLHLIDDAAFEKGLARLEADLQNRPLLCHSYYLLLWGEKP
ncbi:MAG: class I SAM-dependent methyltransferase [Chloroflexi bacterium]|nr:class I SAM-dependent methyltransferase [Chloroflexota bacterium]